MKCPKCGHSQAAGRECVECGIIFEKFHAIQKRHRERSMKKSSPEDTAAGESMDSPVDALQYSLRGLLQTWFWVPYRTPWKPTPKYGVIALTLFFAYLLFLLFREPFYQLYPQTNVMDSTILSMFRKVDLVFHEGGHWIFGIFGNRTLAILGGSLNQMLIPFIVVVAFWHRRDASGTAFGLIWLFVNLLEVAIYMADARHPVLPLIGNLDPYGSHDWLNLFNIWDLWTSDILIAKTTYSLGWVGMIGTALWYVWTGFNNLSKGDDSSAHTARPYQ